ncbi:MAG TPA: RidA family protein [Allosphingosinicella sp.]|jgi:enamine deaminase RidA (YjgF/YER057c/UK114 family)
MKFLQPPGWHRPKGYSNGISAKGRLIFTAGVVGWDEEQRFAAADLPGQFRQLLLNTLAILAEDGADAHNIVRMTWYVVNRDDYVANLSVLGGIYRELIGRHYPTMAVVEVAALVEHQALIEIETIAVVPE